MRRIATGRQRRGAAALEAALALPLLLTVLVGILELGWLFHGQQAVERALRAGCRDGAVAVAPADPAAVATATMTARLTDAGFDCGAACSSDAALGWSAGEPFLDCSLTLDHAPLTGLIPGLDGLDLGAATRRRVEGVEG